MLSVSALMISLARQLRMTPDETRLAGMAGMLLDIGVSRIGVDLGSVHGRVDRIDPQVWQWHASIGRDMLDAAGDVPEEVLQVELRHHERLDGTGFTPALAGSEIDVYSRMGR